MVCALPVCVQPRERAAFPFAQSISLNEEVIHVLYLNVGFTNFHQRGPILDSLLLTACVAHMIFSLLVHLDYMPSSFVVVGERFPTKLINCKIKN